MNTAPVIWKRSDLVLPQPFDTILFDVDGVLIKTTNSFRKANIAVTEYITGTIQGLDWGQDEGLMLVTMADIEVFKQAGGFNSDWDMCYLLSALATARLREWKGTALAERSTREWASLAREASLQMRGGRVWVETTFPASALTDYNVIADVFNECYWGAEELRKRIGREPKYLPDALGFVQNEEMLFSPDFFARLRQAGIKHLGMITGRIGAEVESALERMEVHCGECWWDVVIAADQYTKPDPQALRAAMEKVGTRGGLYIGDTADDFDLVRRYRLDQQNGEPEILAAVVVNQHEEDLYRQRGADVLVHSVEELLNFVSMRS